MLSRFNPCALTTLRTSFLFRTRLTKAVFARFSPKLANDFLRKFSGVHIAHHGLQRSGTNYLNECLWRIGIPPLNSFDEDRDSPRHKHCRWYPEKSIVPSFLQEQYGNDYVVKSIFELNQAAGYPLDTVHVVIYKEKVKWIVSALNWGFRCNWFRDQGHGLEGIKELERDYDAYLSFWSSLEAESPGLVAIAQQESVSGDPIVLRQILSRVGIDVNTEKFDGKIDVVPQSPRGREAMFCEADIADRLMKE
jgi:hypothetical protein